MENGRQPLAGSSKTEKAFRFSRTGKAFLKDYFHNRNKAPKKKERQEILAHLKELGDTEATDTRVSNWFVYHRREDKKNRPLPLPTPAPAPNEQNWVDARHKSLWPSLTKESLQSLEELYAEHVDQDDATNPPYDLWAEGLDAKPAHVRMWCKFKARQSTRKSRPDAVSVAGASSQMTEGRSQLPTPGSSTSPEPQSASTAWSFPSPSAIKDEPPVSPVVETTQFQPPGPQVKSSMRLHEAIESAFSTPLQPPTSPVQLQIPPSPAAQTNQQRKPSSRNSLRTIDIVPPPTPPSISANGTTVLTPTPLPSALITSPPPKPEHPPPLPHREPSAPPSPEDSIPGPSTQPIRDIPRERTNLATGIASKLDELEVVFSSTHGLSQFAGNLQDISRRNQQFLDDVAVGRFAHLRLNRAHLANDQAAGAMPEFNPLKVLADRRDSKGKGKEREKEDEMEVD